MALSFNMLLSEGQFPLLQNDVRCSNDFQSPKRWNVIKCKPQPISTKCKAQPHRFFFRKNMLHGAQGFPFCAGNWNGDKRGIYRKNSRLKLFCTKSMCIGTTQKRTKRLSPFWVATFSSKMSHKTVFVTCAFRPHRIAQAHAKRLSRSTAFFSKIVA